VSTSDDPHAFQMGLMDHLHELRKRLIISLTLIAVGAIAAYTYASPLFDWLSKPYFDAFGSSPLIGTSPAEAWVLKVKVSIFAGAVLMSPALFYQVWAFVSPGLYSRERRLLIPFVVCSTALFVGGAVFCYHVVLPYSFTFFYDEFKSIGVTPTIRVGDNLSMTVTTLVGFGAVFELPLLTFFLARAGIVDHRFLLNWFRHAVVLIFVVAAILTPPDVLTQILMAGPLLILYGVSIGIAWWVAPRPPPDSADSGLVESPKAPGSADKKLLFL
jgi:sec-independent protein translocase protein TatC